jgi:hypothetical protein
VHKVLRVLFRNRWPKLTEADLDRLDGRVARLMTLLGEKYGYPHQRAERELLEFLDDSMRKVDRGALSPGRVDGSGPQVARIGGAGKQGGEAMRDAGQGKERPRSALVDAPGLR